jgi:hypothetical protein
MVAPVHRFHRYPLLRRLPLLTLAVLLGLNWRAQTRTQSRSQCHCLPRPSFRLPDRVMSIRPVCSLGAYPTTSGVSVSRQVPTAPRHPSPRSHQGTRAGHAQKPPGGFGSDPRIWDFPLTKEGRGQCCTKWVGCTSMAQGESMFLEPVYLN